MRTLKKLLMMVMALALLGSVGLSPALAQEEEGMFESDDYGTRGYDYEYDYGLGTDWFDNDYYTGIYDDDNFGNDWYYDTYDDAGDAGFFDI